MTSLIAGLLAKRVNHESIMLKAMITLVLSWRHPRISGFSELLVWKTTAVLSWRHPRISGFSKWWSWKPITFASDSIAPLGLIYLHSIARDADLSQLPRCFVGIGRWWTSRGLLTGPLACIGFGSRLPRWWYLRFHRFAHQSSPHGKPRSNLSWGRPW